MGFPWEVIVFFGVFFLTAHVLFALTDKLAAIWQERQERKLQKLLKDLHIEFEFLRSSHGILKKGLISGAVLGIFITLSAMWVTTKLRPGPLVAVLLWTANFFLFGGLVLGFFDKMFVCPKCKKRTLFKTGMPPLSPIRKYASRNYVYTFVCRSCKFTAVEEFFVRKL
jgi:hypothetical protein